MKLKSLIRLTILIVLCLIIYYQFFTPMSDEERQVNGLEARFNSAARLLVSSGRITAVSGMETLSDSENAFNQAKKIYNDLIILKPGLTEEAAKARAEELEIRIQEFFKKNDVLY